MNSDRKIPVHIEVGDIINGPIMQGGLDVPCLIALCFEEGEHEGAHEVVLGTSEASLELITQRLGDNYEIVNDYHPPRPLGD